MRKLEEWIDFMEGDLDQLAHSKLELLLKHSVEDQEVYRNLCRLRRMVADADPATDIEPVLNNSQYLSSFYTRVMKGVTAIAKESVPASPVAPSPGRKLSPTTCKS